MVFSIVIIVLLGIVVFFHYVQGFFSATISAMLCVLAAVLAVSYDETVVNLLLKGKMADQAHSIMLCSIFAVVYLVLRTIFDAAVPGNVRVPGTLDKIGSILMGIIAGIFVTGIFAIAVQMLPFDPGISFMGYSRYAIKDNPLNPDVLLPSSGGGQAKDTSVYGEMEDTSMSPDKEKGLWIPVDDIVLNTVYHLSDGGSLSGDRTLASIHPDYLGELFGERLGIQVGARRSALYTPTNGSISVDSIFTSSKPLPAADGQVKELRPKGYKAPTQVKAGAGETILIVRVKVAGNATDDADQFFRFSTGSVRMVGPNAQGVYKDYFPVGMLESGTTVLVNKPDDFLFLPGDKEFDAVFVVDSSFVTPGKPFSKIAPGVLLTVKRFANLNLEGESVKEPILPSADVALTRNKLVVVPPPPPAGAVTPAAVQAPTTPATPSTPDNTPPPSVTPPAAPAAVVTTPGKDISDTLTVTPGNGFLAPGSIAIGTTTSADPDAQNAAVTGGTISLKGGLITAAKVDPAASLTQLNQGVQSASQFFTPTDRTMVQAVVHPYENNWDWIGQLVATNLIDSNGNNYPVSGFYIVAKGDTRGLLLRYDAAHSLPAVAAPQGTADSDIYLIFLIPHDTDIKTLKMGFKQQNLDAPLHVQ